MHASLPKYRDPGVNSDEPVPDFRMWSDACDHFEHKRYRDALIATLAHTNPSLFNTLDTSADPFSFSASHGSAKVEMSLDKERFSVRAPFLKMGQEHRIPLMRRVAEVNFQPLTLPSIGLEGDLLSFEFETPLELCQPHKIMAVLREVCIFADRYDDEFINKYKASFFHEPHVENLSALESSAVLGHLAQIVSEYRRYMAFFEEKNADGLKWALIAMSLAQLAAIPTVHGTLRWELNDRIREVHERENELAVRIDAGKRFLDNLCDKIERQEVTSEFYHATSFLSMKNHGSVQQLQQDCQQRREWIYSEINSGDVYSAAFSLRYFFCWVLYEYNLQEDHRQIICNALEQTGGGSTGEGLVVLKGLFESFLEGSPDGRGNRPKKKGFFSKLFD